ncbi:uncharacterized protein [Eucyclogobius newberryi]|uniref:uncharacterized protein n=1 Tax=Eucyclogobius newberryi TaxID=166745 RepID=UPI003B5C5459
MIPNTWSKGLYGSNFCLEGRTAEQVSPFQPSPSEDGPDLYFSQREAGSNPMHLPSRSLGRGAKRARVENIIKSMNASEANPHDVLPAGTSRNTALPGYHMEMFRMHQLQGQYQHCKQVQVQKEAANIKDMGENLSRKQSQNRCFDMRHEVQQINHARKAEDIKLMTDALKCELSKALSTSVDTIFKAHTKHESNKPHLYHPYYSFSPPLSEMTVPVPTFQTEAISLVVRKDKSVPFSQYRTADYGPTLTKKSSKSPPKSDFEKGQSKMIDGSWPALKERSKVSSREGKSLNNVNHTIVKGLPVSRVSHLGESSSLKNVCAVNEGLTTNHLKKAKLMFFYTRYPSSHVLKMCFSDVQFNRCITSQLIKWFSNFREFYYIQMEKFARHAVLQGVTDGEALTVGRESELFRVLNLHYNKTTDFQVPDRFLEVAEITLREFYVAICLRKDQDPSWKKTIYRVISKLDSDVPARFIFT